MDVIYCPALRFILSKLVLTHADASPGARALELPRSKRNTCSPVPWSFNVLAVSSFRSFIFLLAGLSSLTVTIPTCPTLSHCASFLYCIGKCLQCFPQQQARVIPTIRRSLSALSLGARKYGMTTMQVPFIHLVDIDKSPLLILINEFPVSFFFTDRLL
jgi:hypothetical protein